MNAVFTLIKSNLVKQMRRNQFALIIIIGVAIAYFCVPSPSAGYEVFYLGGVRGVYNSAYLGAMASAVSMLVLWLPGFYLLRSQISEDERLKLGQVIASKPISKLRYIAGKAVANCGVLMVMELIFIAAFIAMQFIRGESAQLNLWGYLNPFLQVTLPYIILLSSLTVLFDVVPFLKGVFGNIMAFVFWIILLPLSLENPGNMQLDLFGINRIMRGMLQEAARSYPGISQTAVGFGYNTLSGVRPTFVWNGLDASGAFLYTRLVWVLAAFAVLLVAAAVWGRFRLTPKTECKKQPARPEMPKRQVQTRFCFTAVRTGRFNPLRLIAGEVKSMIAGFPLWWYLLVVTGIIVSALVPVAEYYYVFTLFLLLLMPVWSRMGNRDRLLGTLPLVGCRCSATIRWAITLVSGVVITTGASTGFIFRLALEGRMANLAAFLVGVLFITNLGLALGTLTHSRVPFEGLFIVWYYMGAIQNLPGFDFFGLQGVNTAVYLLITAVLMLVGFGTALLKEKHVLTYASR